MTQDEIIKMAIQAGIKRRTDEFYSEFCDGVYFDDLEAFAKLVAEKEREACAKIADEWAVGWPHPSQVIAERIRERT
jgi:hypothetical protein